MDKLMKTEKTFSICAKTCTLKYNKQEGNASILGDEKAKYIIPIYQRAYSWSEEQLRRFISDIFISYWGNDRESPEEPMFIGTMQLSSKTNNNEQDVIDGQQRLTTFLIFLKILQLKFQSNEELKSLQFDWLTTRVNNGTQQEYLEKVIGSDELSKEEELNPYMKNAFLINELIDEHIKEEEDNNNNFDIDKFIRHVFSNIYFVVIETRAGLSKTLQIFNAINTAGLDLNGGDIFKIRMYEYLKEKKGQGENVFDEICNLYGNIERFNLKIGHQFTNINFILSIYQYILIAKYDLPVALYYYATDTFFERLFDTIFNINQWEHFKNNLENVELSIKDIKQIIDVRYEWEKHWKNKTNQTAEDICSIHLIWWSRYSRYWILTFVFLLDLKMINFIGKRCCCLIDN
jgi:uncharacterized protein with ParB-like and HNH nuclease domain